MTFIQTHQDKIWMIVVVFSITVIGYIRVIKYLRNIKIEIDFLHSSVTNLNDYYNSSGKNSEAYVWLNMNANKIQDLLGYSGILNNYQPPFSGMIYKNIPVVLNFLPEIRKGFSGYTVSSNVYEYYMGIFESILKAVGIKKEQHLKLINQMKNPLIMLIEGFKSIFTLPILLLDWVGLINYSIRDWILNTILFKVVTMIFTTIGVIGSIMTIIMGWHEFENIIMSFINN